MIYINYIKGLINLYGVYTCDSYKINFNYTNFTVNTNQGQIIIIIIIYLLSHLILKILFDNKKTEAEWKKVNILTENSNILIKNQNVK